jgi:nitrite reductase (NADH) small subunit
MIATTSLGSLVVKLGRLSDIPCGEGRLFRIGDQSIAVFRTRGSNVFATESTCPHKGGPLADGLVGADKVICPLHSFVFDLTDGHAVGNRCRALKTYPATVNEEGEILVGVEELLVTR